MAKTLEQHMAKAQAIIKDCERNLVIQNYRNFHRKLNKEIELDQVKQRHNQNKAQSAKK